MPVVQRGERKERAKERKKEKKRKEKRKEKRRRTRTRRRRRRRRRETKEPKKSQGKGKITYHLRHESWSAGTRTERPDRKLSDQKFGNLQFEEERS